MPDDRHMVGWLFPATHMLFDLGRDKPIGGFCREQKMIDTNAVVLLPGTCLIIPERVKLCRIRRGTDRIGQAQIFQRLECGAGLRQEKRVRGPDRRVEAIMRMRNDIIVTCQNKRFFKASRSAAKRCSRAIQASL